ncbi:MAG: amino acid permease [Deltaproteobacteria bacterium]|nr:amino acid permease [Deltaproteobacteria bacterium]
MRKLGPLDATMIVVSGIIGSGIFINPYVVAREVETPFLILAVWILGGVIAMCGAFVFAELGTVVPRAGGQYAFFREAFHPLVGFLHGWALLLIIQSGATAAVAVACGQYVVRLGGLGPGWAVPIAVALLAALAMFHSAGIRPGAVLVNIITIGKTLAIAALVVGAFAVTGKGMGGSVLVPARLGGLGLVSALFAGLVPAMFAYGGWQNANFIVEEMRDPERHLPRAILIGASIVVAVYVSANVAYVHVLGAQGLAATTTPAAELATAVLGPRGADILSVLVIVSTFGFLNLALMTAPRVYFAMARDGLFFERVARISPRTHVPIAAIVVQAVLASAFALSNTYAQLLGYAVFADWIFFSLAGVALIVLRRTRAAAPRPFRTPGYPVVPALFALAGFGIVANTFVADPTDAIIGTAIIALGVPVYLWWRHASAARR